MSSERPTYPLLEGILALRQLRVQPMYTSADVVLIFGVSVRTIQSRVAAGQIIRRDLPGRAKFLPVDLEQFLDDSKPGGGK